MNTKALGGVALGVAASVSWCVWSMSSPAPARAQQPNGVAHAIRATVVRLDEHDVIADVGRGVRAGAILRVFRSISVRHPITHQTLRDRFVIGRVRVVQPGEALSIVRPEGTLERAIEVGDALESEEPAPAADLAPASPRGCPPCPTCTTGVATGTVPASGDPEAAEVVAVWTATLGQSPEDRARLYGIYLERNPGSRFVPAVRAEIEALRRIGAPREIGPDERAGMDRDRAQIGVLAKPVTVAREGGPVEIALVARPESGVRAMILQVRAWTDPAEQQYRPEQRTAFQSIPMQMDGRGHARVPVPRSLVRPPGFAYFVEAVTESGQSVAVEGTFSDPIHVEVLGRAARDEPPSHRSRVRATAEYVSFEDLTGRDWYTATEGDFLYRTLFHALYGVRVGYGVYVGEGGEVDALDSGIPPAPASFTYGYAEMELRLTDIFASIMRVEVGLGRPSNEEDARDGIGGGFQLRLRIGEERGTHLVLAAETVSEIGERAFVALAWESVEHFPMAAEVHVTDQPADTGELGVRLVYELGWRPAETFAIALRVSYQGRRIDHAGPGAGLAATFDW